jgi:hypothetical protein
MRTIDLPHAVINELNEKEEGIQSGGIVLSLRTLCEELDSLGFVLADEGTCPDLSVVFKDDYIDSPDYSQLVIEREDSEEWVLRFIHTLIKQLTLREMSPSPEMEINDDKPNSYDFRFYGVSLYKMGAKHFVSNLESEGGRAKLSLFQYEILLFILNKGGEVDRKDLLHLYKRLNHNKPTSIKNANEAIFRFIQQINRCLAEAGIKHIRLSNHSAGDSSKTSVVFP